MKEHSSINQLWRGLNKEYKQLTTCYDETDKTLWCTYKSPFFTPELLKDMRAMQDAIVSIFEDNEKFIPRFIVWRSQDPNLFNLGIDLEHVIACIKAKDYTELEFYLQSCLDVLYINAMNLDLPIVSFSLISGRCYSLGFDMALSADIIVAADNARCGFPEVKYSLLPPMLNFVRLLKQLSRNEVTNYLFEGKVLQKDLLEKTELIDFFVPDYSHAEALIKKEIKKRQHKHSLNVSLYKVARQAVYPHYSEFKKYIEEWLDIATRLKHQEILKLEKIYEAQKKVINPAE